MCAGQIGCECHGPVRAGQGLFENPVHHGRIRTDGGERDVAQRHGPPAIGAREAWIGRHRLVERRQCRIEAFIFAGSQQLHAAQVTVERSGTGRAAQAEFIRVLAQQRHLQAARHRGGDIRLHGQPVILAAIVTARPILKSGACIDQLRRNAQPRALPAHAAFQHRAHVQPPGDIAYCRRRSLERKRGHPRRHLQPADAAERIDQLLRQAIGEIRLARIAAHIIEWQHGHRMRWRIERRRIVGGRWVMPRGQPNPACGRCRQRRDAQRLAVRTPKLRCGRPGGRCHQEFGGGECEGGCTAFQPHLHGQAVTAPCHGNNHRRGFTFAVQHLAQRGNRLAEIAFFDDAAGPDGGQKLIFLHQPARIFNEIEQCIE